MSQPKKFIRVWYQLGDTMYETSVRIVDFSPEADFTPVGGSEYLRSVTIASVLDDIRLEILKKGGTIENLRQIRFGEIIDG